VSGILLTAFLLSLAYVHGMATTCAIAGTLAGFFGAKANMQLYMQMAEVLSVFVLLFCCFIYVWNL